MGGGGWWSTVNLAFCFGPKFWFWTWTKLNNNTNPLHQNEELWIDSYSQFGVDGGCIIGTNIQIGQRYTCQKLLVTKLIDAKLNETIFFQATVCEEATYRSADHRCGVVWGVITGNGKTCRLVVAVE